MQRRQLNHLAGMAAGVAVLPLSVFAQASNPVHRLPAGNTCLLATASDWARLKKRMAQEPDLAAFHASLLEVAQLQMALPLIEYKKIGRRLLNVSRSLLQRVLILSYAWQMTGQPNYLQSAVGNLLAAADFVDWNPSHFLDVGEATAAMAMGVDWLHEALEPEHRERILRSILVKGLRPGLDPTAQTNWWHRAENNWNQVCFGGLTLGALAVLAHAQAAQDKQEAQALLTQARVGIANGLKPYAPDGVYPEGPSYWGYGTSYQVLMMAALQSAQGHAWLMEAAPGLMASAGAYVQQHGMQGEPFNFADGGDRPRFEPALFWMARELKQSSLLKFEMMQLGSVASRRMAIRSQRLAPLAALWWPAPHAAVQNILPLNWYGAGECPLVVFRQSWSDPRGLYFAIKGGSASLNHAHMDVGSFVFERDGVRWGIDLGLQDYESLESKGIDLWSKKQNSQRWQVFRLNNHAHSTLTIDAQLHQVAGKGQFDKVQLEGPEPTASLDMRSVFQGQASQVRRSVVVKQRTVWVQDELQGLRPGARVRWQMPTRASIQLQGSRAVLSQSNQELVVDITQGAQAFSVLSLEKPMPEFNAPNPGVSMLWCEAVADAKGQVSIAVRLGV